MKIFHIVFKEKETDFLSKGKNYTALNEVEALFKFRSELPDAQFLMLHDLNGIADIRGGRKERTEIKDHLISTLEPVPDLSLTQPDDYS